MTCPTTPLRVLHVSAYFAPAFRYGGPARSVFELCRHLQDAGIDVEVLTTTANGPEELPASPSSGEEYDGIRVRYLPRAFPRRFFGARGLAAAVDRALNRCDLVHLHGLWNAPVIAAAREARRRRIPYLISPRGMLEPAALARGRLRKTLAYRLVERRNLSGASLLHAGSSREARTIERLGLQVPVVTLPNGIDSPPVLERGRFRSARGIPAESPLIVFLGRIHPVKRIDLLIEAFRAVAVSFPASRLVIAGPDECGLAAGLMQQCGADAGRVIWTGHLDGDEKWRLLADASVLALCSDSESFGVSVAEALTAGVPVVATKSCPWEELEQARAGFWVDQTPSAIADALKAVLCEPQRARKMGERGQELVRSRFAWPPIVAAMTALYRGVLAASAANRAAAARRPADVRTGLP